MRAHHRRHLFSANYIVSKLAMRSFIRCVPCCGWRVGIVLNVIIRSAIRRR